MAAGKRRDQGKVNLFDLKPVRKLQWETRGNDQVVLLVPRFYNRFLVKHLVPRLRKPFIQVELDDYGSYAWRHCDGEMTVLQIAGKMKEKFSEAFDPTFERLGRFINQLAQNEFISLSK